jgi:cobalamin biosynthesis Mg chelatase CobN
MRSVVVADTSAVVVWVPPTSDGGQPILGYLVFVEETGARVTNSALGLSVAQCSTLQTTCQIEGLSSTKKYAFMVRAVNAVGESDSSAPLDPFAKDEVTTAIKPPATEIPTAAKPVTTKPTKAKPAASRPATQSSSKGVTTKPVVTTTTTVPTTAPATTVSESQSVQRNFAATTWSVLGVIAGILLGWFLLFAWRRRRKSE